MNTTIILALILSGCENPDKVEIVSSKEAIEETKNDTVESLDSLDRTLENMDKMIADMEKMNNNLDAIFKAVTECKTDAECEALSKQYVKEFEESRGG